MSADGTVVRTFLTIVSEPPNELHPNSKNLRGNTKSCTRRTQPRNSAGADSANIPKMQKAALGMRGIHDAVASVFPHSRPRVNRDSTHPYLLAEIVLNFQIEADSGPRPPRSANVRAQATAVTRLLCPAGFEGARLQSRRPAPEIRSAFRRWGIHLLQNWSGPNLRSP